MMVSTNICEKEDYRLYPLEQDIVRKAAHETVGKLKLSSEQAEALHIVLDEVLICE
jgi:hypothetical protein